MIPYTVPQLELSAILGFLRAFSSTGWSYGTEIHELEKEYSRFEELNPLRFVTSVDQLSGLILGEEVKAKKIENCYLLYKKKPLLN